MSVATEPLTVPKLVPKAFLDADGGFSLDLQMFVGALVLVVFSTTGYFFWNVPGWCCSGQQRIPA